MGLWGDVADFAATKVCEENRKYKSCSCKKCPETRKIQKAALDLEEGRPTDLTPMEIFKWVKNKRCSRSKKTQDCNHNGCWLAERLIINLMVKLAS